MLALLVSEDSSFLIIRLILSAGFGIACAVVASGRGRSGVAWFLVGLLFPCIALVVLLTLPDLKRQALEKEAQERTNRRLSEQIAKEKQIAEARHTLTERRLGAHDQVLQMDTSVTQDAPRVALPPPVPTGGTWFYVNGSTRTGPVGADEIRKLVRNGVLLPAHLVWREGMSGWQALETIPEFQGDLA